MQGIYLYLVLGILLFVIAFLFIRREGFDIPLTSSSAWDWNVGPGYGAGYGTGYAMWGVWPASLPKEPWKNWMWGRRPLIFFKPFTQVPQIDYNSAPDMSKPISTYQISLQPDADGVVKLAVNGFTAPTLQLDRNRTYFFYVYTPGAAFTITTGEKELMKPLSEGSIEMVFDESDPDVLYYSIPDVPNSGGVIYLNSLK